MVLISFFLSDRTSEILEDVRRKEKQEALGKWF